MDKKKLNQMKEDYMGVQIPDELEFRVKSTIKQARKDMKRKEKQGMIKKASIAVAASVTLITVGLNASPALANSLSDIPIVGGIVQVLTFREYKVDEATYNADIKIPEIHGLENEELQKSLNEKYLIESKELYEQFMEDVKELEEIGGGHLGIDNGYIVKTDTDKILSIGRYVVNTAASSSTIFQYDTIDKEKQILITLPSLFKDDSYIDIISDNIKSQMKEQMKLDENKIYWVEGEESDSEVFEKISKDQSFYINPEGKLVIAFDKYEVAPGYMGTPEFIIPTEILSTILVGDEYIK
jgi:hypothetical protein